MLEPYDEQGARVPAVETGAGLAALLRDTGRDDAWLLAVADVPQSYVDLTDPTHLEFAYVRLLADLVDACAPAGAPLRAVHLGGGAASLPRYVAATRPGSGQLVVEVDPALAALVEDRLGTAGFRLVVGDARAELVALPGAVGPVDLVVLDAFAGSAVPPHLTTLEFLDTVRAVLAPTGTYAANIADGGELDYARAVTATVAARFAHVALLTTPSVLRGRRFGNVVLAASDAPLPDAALARSAAGRAAEPARLLTGDRLRDWLGGAAPLTDATAGPSPVPPPGAFTLSGPVVDGRPAEQDPGALPG